MQTISDSVGYKGANKKSDVALVQAILLKTACPLGGNNSKTKTYLTSYDGEYGKGTEDALRAFQGDYVNVTPDGQQCMQNPDATDASKNPLMRLGRS